MGTVSAVRAWKLIGILGVFLLSFVVGSAFGQARQRIIFTTDFGFNGRHAYYYVALDKGYYAAEGLDVEIVRGGGSADAIRQVAAGRAKLGFADMATLVLARGNDRVPVKVVAIVYAKPPQAIYALADSSIRRPQDLEGKTVADVAASANTAIFPVYARAVGINAQQVRWVVADGAALPGLLLAGRVDAIGQFIVGEPLLNKLVAPKALVRFAYIDAGLDYYGNGIIAADDTIRRQPDLVRAFVRATLRGMDDAFRNPAEAGRILAKYQPQIAPDIGQGETEAVRELSQFPLTRERGLGTVDPARVRKTIQVVAEVFSLKTPVAPEDVYAPGLTGR